MTMSRGRRGWGALPRRATLAVFIVAGALALLGGTAAAQQAISPQFTREYQAGIDAYRLGQYAEARAHLAKAADLEPSLPGPHRWLAAIDQAEEKWADCVKHARAAIKLNPQSSEIAATRQLHDECRTSLGKSTFTGDFEGGGALAVTSSATGATVSVNGLRYGSAPLAPRALAAGRIEIKVEKPGWIARTVEVDILPGVVTDVDVELEPDPAAQAADPNRAVTHALPITGWLELEGDLAGATILINGVDATVDASGRFERTPGTYEVIVSAPGRDRWRRRVRIARGQETRATVELPSAEARRSKRRVGVGAVLGGAVLAGAGATFALLAGKAREEAGDWAEIERTRPDLSDASLEHAPLHTRADIQDSIDRGDRWALVSNVVYGAAAVSVGVGIYFLVGSRSDDRPGAPPPFAIAPLGDRGVVVSKELRW
jgi:hypothetical protein